MTKAEKGDWDQIHTKVTIEYIFTKGISDHIQYWVDAGVTDLSTLSIIGRDYLRDSLTDLTKRVKSVSEMKEWEAMYIGTTPCRWLPNSAWVGISYDFRKAIVSARRYACRWSII